MDAIERFQRNTAGIMSPSTYPNERKVSNSNDRIVGFNTFRNLQGEILVRRHVVLVVLRVEGPIIQYGTHAVLWRAACRAGAALVDTDDNGNFLGAGQGVLCLSVAAQDQL